MHAGRDDLITNSKLMVQLWLIEQLRSYEAGIIETHNACVSWLFSFQKVLCPALASTTSSIVSAPGCF